MKIDERVSKGYLKTSHDVESEREDRIETDVKTVNRNRTGWFIIGSTCAVVLTVKSSVAVLSCV